VKERPDLHPDELLQELLDERLLGEERAAVEAHVEGCARCQRLRETLLSSRRLVRQLPAEATAVELGTILDGVLASVSEAAAEVPPLWRRRWVLAAGVAALLVIVLGAVVLPSRLAARHAVDELLALHTAASPVFGERAPAALEARLAAALPVRVRVLDLAAMGLELLGGGTGRVAGSPAGWMLYRGPAGERLLCVMFRGKLVALPAADETRVRGPFTFRIYRRGGRTVVSWQEGVLVCALIGGGDPEGVISLAQAKAMMPASP
jgi:anti-sigma factor RsiW